MEYFTLATSIVSFTIACIALRFTFARRYANAADRALNRFSRFNEILFAHPEFQDVFYKCLGDIKESSGGGRDYANAKAFIWFVLNQMEGVFMDHHRNNLTRESFACYNTWFHNVIDKGGAIRGFLEERGEANLKYFAPPYQEYIREVLRSTGRQSKGES